MPKYFIRLREQDKVIEVTVYRPTPRSKWIATGHYRRSFLKVDAATEQAACETWKLVAQCRNIAWPHDLGQTQIQ